MIAEFTSTSVSPYQSTNGEEKAKESLFWTMKRSPTERAVMLRTETVEVIAFRKKDHHITDGVIIMKRRGTGKDHHPESERKAEIMTQVDAIPVIVTMKETGGTGTILVIEADTSIRAVQVVQVVGEEEVDPEQQLNSQNKCFMIVNY